MSPIPSRHQYVLEKSIDVLGEKWTAFHNVGFTHDEFLAMFAPEDHWPILKGASEIADVSTAGGYHEAQFTDSRFTEAFGSNHVTLLFQVHQVNNHAPLLPRNHIILSAIPAVVRDKLTSWVIERSEIMFNINRARAVLSWMTANCATAAQIRYLWPTILAVASLNESTHDFADRIRDVRPQRALPAMPPEVKAGCRLAAGTIASAMLLGEPTVFSAPVTCQITRVDAQKREGALGTLQGA